VFLLVYVAIATAVWAIFNPGILADDSVVQLRQATTGQFADGHPPFMAILMYGVFLVGGSMSLMTYLQAVLVVLGYRFFTISLLRTLDPVGSVLKHESIAMLLLVILGCFTPFLLYCVSLCKDIWFLGLLFWTGGLSLRIARSPLVWYVDVLVTSVLMALACMIRYNAIVLLPFFGLLNFLLARRWKLAFAILPALLWFAGSQAIKRNFTIKKENTVHSVMALEILGVSYLVPGALGEFPYLRGKMFNNEYRRFYKFGDNGCMYRFLRVDDVVFTDGKELRAEYWKALKNYPLTLMRVKFKAFQELVDNRKTKDRFPGGIWYGGKRYEQNPRYAAIRGGLERYYDNIQKVFFVRSMLLGQGFWVCVLLFVSLYALYNAWKPVHLALLLILLGYTHTFLIAAPGDVYRYLLPPIVFMQILVIGLVAVAGANRAIALVRARRREAA
jgi:hypothetical protein